MWYCLNGNVERYVWKFNGRKWQQKDWQTSYSMWIKGKEENYEAMYVWED